MHIGWRREDWSIGIARKYAKKDPLKQKGARQGKEVMNLRSRRRRHRHRRRRRRRRRRHRWGCILERGGMNVRAGHAGVFVWTGDDSIYIQEGLANRHWWELSSVDWLFIAKTFCPPSILFHQFAQWDWARMRAERESFPTTRGKGAGGGWVGGSEGLMITQWGAEKWVVSRADTRPSYCHCLHTCVSPVVEQGGGGGGDTVAILSGGAACAT